jgi:hypothetical protein
MQLFKSIFSRIFFKLKISINEFIEFTSKSIYLIHEIYGVKSFKSDFNLFFIKLILFFYKTK